MHANGYNFTHPIITDAEITLDMDLKLIQFSDAIIQLSLCSARIPDIMHPFNQLKGPIAAAFDCFIASSTRRSSYQLSIRPFISSLPSPLLELNRFSNQEIG